MGGSFKKKTSSRPMTEVPAAMPGQLDALSQQLAMGYGQQPSDLLSLMNQYYQPMQLPDYGPNAAPVYGKDSKSGGGGLGDILSTHGQHYNSDGQLVLTAMPDWLLRGIEKARG